MRVLRGLIEDGRFEIAALLAHRKLPASEDAARSLRPEYAEFERLAAEHGFPLFAVDTREQAGALDGLAAAGEFDFLLTVSWRFLVPEAAYSRARICALNMHRGKLPRYAGAEPVRRALEAGEEEIVLSVQKMAAEIDAGEVLVEKTHPAGRRPGMSAAKNAERIKTEMLPLYPVAAIEAIDRVLKECEGGR